MRRCETGTERGFGERRRRRESGRLKKNRLRKGGERRERKREVCNQAEPLVLFHQASPWKLASPSLPSSLSFAWKEVIRESERGRDRERERGTVTRTELSEALCGNKQSNLLCFPFPLPSLFFCFLVDKTLYIQNVCVCVCMWLG